MRRLMQMVGVFIFLVMAAVAQAEYEFNGHYVAIDGTEMTIRGPKEVAVMGPDKPGMAVMYIRPSYLVNSVKMNKKRRSIELDVERLGKGHGTFVPSGLQIRWDDGTAMDFKKDGAN